MLLLGWLGLNRRSPPTGLRGFWLPLSAVADVTLVAGRYQLLYNRGAFTRISLKKEHEEESFWARNKDKIILLIIGR